MITKKRKAMTLDIIYEPKGAALEYAPLACNLFKGCIFGCKYCYGPACLRMSKEEYHSGPNIKTDVIERVTKDAKRLQAANDKREILLSFIGDVCQTPETVELTRQVLEILGEHDLNAMILTKGGTKAVPLFPVMQRYKFRFGTSVVWAKDELREKWEPNAATPFDRYDAVWVAQRRYDLKTWVSLEPIIETYEALVVIRSMSRIVDYWKVGKINHMPELEKAVDWYQFHKDVIALLDSVGADYYIKESLQRYEVKP